MNKIFYSLFLGLVLFGCVAATSSVKNVSDPLSAQMIEKNNDEVLELARDMEQERVKAIYIVVISEPEIITAKPQENVHW